MIRSHINLPRLFAWLVLLLPLMGCASKHAYMAQPKALGDPQYQCSAPGQCELMRAWEPSQLTSVGCVAHTILTAGHIAWECREPKNGFVPQGGRWIWSWEKKKPQLLKAKEKIK